MSFLKSLLSRPKAGTASGGWLGVHAGESCLLGAVALSHGARPLLQLMSPAPVPAQSAALRAWRSGLRRGTRANVVLRSNEYRVLPIDPPELAPDELREAARWQIADTLDFSVEDAALDLLAIPSNQGGMRKQSFVVAAPGERITPWVERCRAADLPLGAVDIPEMAMRNLSVLAAGDAAHAFVYVGIRSTRMALIWKRELCSFRQLDISGSELAATPGHEQGPLVERLALEIQRTADSFSRQFSGVELETLWLVCAAEPERLADSLSLLVPQRVQLYDLRSFVDIEGGAQVVDLAQGRDYLLAIGGALRQEAA